MKTNLFIVQRNRKLRWLVSVAAILLMVTGLLFSAAIPVQAAPTDEILNFDITVDVNQDASLQMTYSIDWKVLDDSIGALEWIDLGVPNSDHTDITPLTDTIDYINDNGSTLQIYLDRSYYEDEVVSLSFSMVQNRMYQIDKYTSGETVYTFTPAWFDGMDIDNLTIHWNSDQAISWQPDCLMDGGYLVFGGSVPAGDTFSISVTYPNDAFGFTDSLQLIEDPDFDTRYSEDSSLSAEDVILGLLGLAVVFGAIAFPIILVVRFFQWISGGAGFGSGQTDTIEKKITRTKIEYYDNCPSCGAAHEERKETCSYCGRSMVKSKEVVEENQIEHPEKYVKNGTYRYGSSPNTYIHVNVVPVHVSRPAHRSGAFVSGAGSHRSSSHVSRSSSHSSSRSSSSSHHSSCACACASSCACACACASSGRAGCSVKDFFKESLHKNKIRVSGNR